MLYIVQPGDSLYTVSSKFGISIESIKKNNQVLGNIIYIGQTLYIPSYGEVTINVNTAYIRSGPGKNYSVLTTMTEGTKLPVALVGKDWFKVRLYNGKTAWISAKVVVFKVPKYDKPLSEILGYYTLEESLSLPSSFLSFANNTDKISETGLFLYRISANNPTKIENFGQFSDEDINTLVAIAHRNNVRIVPVIHNLLYRPGGTILAKNIVKVLVSEPEDRTAFALSILNLLKTFKYDGVNLDIEDVYVEDSKNLSLLYEEIAKTIKPKGYFLSVSIPARTRDGPLNPFSDPFDYGTIGKYADEFVAMLYNEHGWPGSGPGPVISIGWMEKVLNYTISKMPRSKIMAGISVFGFDFNLTTGKSTYLTHNTALKLAKKYNKNIFFDKNSQTPMFKYKDENGNEREVWFENSQSIYSKIKLASKLGIKGVALWRLGMEDPSIWPVLGNDIVVGR